MKHKNTLSLLVLLILHHFSIIAKNNEHLKFKGIPIDGSLSEFASKLHRKGFDLLQMDHGYLILQGDFAGYQDCYIGTYSLEGVDHVSRVGVVFPTEDTWELVSRNYYELKKTLSKKYGSPTEMVEEFDSSIHPASDSAKIQEVIMDRCTYYSTYEVEHGTIKISIDKANNSGAYVGLMYFDKANGNLVRKMAIENL